MAPAAQPPGSLPSPHSLPASAPERLVLPVAVALAQQGIHLIDEDNAGLQLGGQGEHSPAGGTP